MSMIKRLKNRARSAFLYKRGTSEIDTGPVELIIEITSVCNLSCPMCPRPGMVRGYDMMEVEMFRSIIEQIKNTVELVYLSGGLGDPTVHPDLGKFIKICTENNVRVGVSTNATLLRPSVIDALLSPGPDLLLLSLDGATKETHEKIRVGSNFERTMERIENFLAEKVKRNSRRPHTICQMIHMPINEQEAEKFQEKWKSTPGVDEVRLKKFLHLQGAEYHPETDGTIVQPEKQKSCILPWRQLSISADGTVSICCRDLDFQQSIGHLNKSSIDEIWHGTVMNKNRELLATGRKCEIDACNGCEGLSTSALTLVGAAVVDDYVIRRMLPMVEKISRIFGIKALDYE